MGILFLATYNYCYGGDYMKTKSSMTKSSMIYFNRYIGYLVDDNMRNSMEFICSRL